MEDPEFETFYTKNILLNEGIRAWMVLKISPMSNSTPEEVLPVETPYNAPLVIVLLSGRRS